MTTEDNPYIKACTARMGCGKEDVALIIISQ